MDASLLIWESIAPCPDRVSSSGSVEAHEERTDEQNEAKMGCQRSVLSVTQLSLSDAAVKTQITTLYVPGSRP